jgi:hypothetical protein
MIAIMVIGVASAAVIERYNSTATVEMDLGTPSNCEIETLVSVDGSNFTNEIVLDNVSGGDVVTLTFSHRNVSPNEEVLFGTVRYGITCSEGLDMSNVCKGSIEDFYNYGPVIQPVEPKCLELESGLIYTSTYNEIYPVNTKEHVVIIDRTTVELVPMDFSMFIDETSYTKVEIHFNEFAVGSYTVDGSVDTYLFHDIPRRGADQINSTE